MNIIYAREPFPSDVESTIFLAGPTPRDKFPSWRSEAIRLFQEMDFKGHIFVPEDRTGDYKGDYNDQIGWEEEGLHRADCIVFWVPREMSKMPALTTNDEWGAWKNSGKVVFGAPNEAQSVRYQEAYAAKFGVPSFRNLRDTLRAAVERVQPGARRVGGECQVPLFIWKLESFQAWYRAQQDAGNRLDGARICWTFRVGPQKNFVFSWVAHVDVFVKSENRNKKNEFVFGRTDIATVLLWHPGASFLDTEIVLIKEFRSPARTPDGFIHELPGGSSKSSKPAFQTAVEEVYEEVGLLLRPSRLREIGTRQLAGTLSSFSGTLLAAELTCDEMVQLRKDAASGKVRGVESDTERTYIEIVRVADLLRSPMTDWSMMGMVFAALGHLS